MALILSILSTATYVYACLWLPAAILAAVIFWQEVESDKLRETYDNRTIISTYLIVLVFAPFMLILHLWERWTARQPKSYQAVEGIEM